MKIKKKYIMKTGNSLIIVKRIPTLWFVNKLQNSCKSDKKTVILSVEHPEISEIKIIFLKIKII